MSKYRKAIAAFFVPILGLPLAGWISGEVEFNVAAVVGAVLAGANAIAVFYFKNAPSDQPQ